MGIPAVSYCYHGDGSGESIPDGDLPIAILGRDFKYGRVLGSPEAGLLKYTTYSRIPLLRGMSKSL
jgi:hypothetical protein